MLRMRTQNHNEKKKRENFHLDLSMNMKSKYDPVVFRGHLFINRRNSGLKMQRN